MRGVAEGARCLCRHCSNKSAEFVQRWRLRRVRHAELLQHHGVDVVRERCFLLGLTPEAEPEFLEVLAHVEEDLGPPPLFRVVETPATLAKLHRQGAFTSLHPAAADRPCLRQSAPGREADLEYQICGEIHCHL